MTNISFFISEKLPFFSLSVLIFFFFFGGNSFVRNKVAVAVARTFTSEWEKKRPARNIYGSINVRKVHWAQFCHRHWLMRINIITQWDNSLDKFSVLGSFYLLARFLSFRPNHLCVYVCTYICYRLCVVQITNCKYIPSQMVFTA